MNACMHSHIDLEGPSVKFEKCVFTPQVDCQLATTIILGYAAEYVRSTRLGLGSKALSTWLPGDASFLKGQCIVVCVCVCY